MENFMELLTLAKTGVNVWTGINWKIHKYNVLLIQRRIQEAYIEKDMLKVLNLQRILASSLSARLLAVKKASSSKGSSTAGLDGVVWKTDLEKLKAVDILKKASTMNYKSTPVKRVMIPKENNPSEIRPLGIPTMYDRAAQVLWMWALEPIAEITADKNSYGYRIGLNTSDALTAMYQGLQTSPWPRNVYEADIKGFFDNIDHQWILSNIPIPKHILLQFIKAGVVFNGTYSDTVSGVPQGGIISPIIANIVLDGLEKVVETAALDVRTKNPNLKNAVWRVVRYADDFVILGPSNSIFDGFWKDILIQVNQFIAVRGLQLHPIKSVITRLDSQQVTFLGVNYMWVINNRSGKRNILIVPNPDKVNILLEDLRIVCIKNINLTLEELILILNPKLQGWAINYRITSASAVFLRVEKVISSIILDWLIVKFPNTNRKTLYSTHFTLVNGSYTPFATQSQNIIMLYRCHSLKLIRKTAPNQAFTILSALSISSSI